MTADPGARKDAGSSPRGGREGEVGEVGEAGVGEGGEGREGEGENLLKRI